MDTTYRAGTFYEKVKRQATLAWYPISISLVMFSLFSTFGLAAGQVQEALANYVADPDRPWSSFEWPRAAVTFMALFVFAATMRYWTARLLGIDLHIVNTPRVMNSWQRVFVGIAWFAPWIGAGLSFTDAALSLLGAQAHPERGFLGDVVALGQALAENPLQTPFGVLALAAFVAPVALLALWWSPFAAFMRRGSRNLQVVKFLQHWSLPAVFLGFAALFLWMPASGIAVARELGPVPLICIGFAALTAAGSYLIHLGRSRGWPAFPVVAAAPFALGAFGFDDNHHIRRLSETPIEVERPSIAEALDDFGAREPLILVSAEGGGIRAAHFTAMVLARLADRCPRVARRIFAISGVSGGAVGAAAYRASLDLMPLDDSNACDMDENAPAGPRQRALDAMFERDHLSPTLAKQMFPEMMQAFLPAALPEGQRAFVPQTDRHLGFELSLEQAFAEAFGVSRENSPFSASMFAAGDHAAPHLLINMAEASSGGVYVASDLDLAQLRPRQHWLHDFRCLWSAEPEPESCDVSGDFRLSTLAAASARFPIIAPAGTVRARDEEFHFVDGGYFDNSGAETIAGIVEHVQRQARPGRRTPRIAILHIDSNPYRQRLPVKWRLDLDVHELQAVLATREERVRISVSRLNNLYQDRRLCSLRFVEVADGQVPLRLGWILSRQGAEELRAQAAEQLEIAFPSAAVCDVDDSLELHAARDRYAERLAMGP